MNHLLRSIAVLALSLTQVLFALGVSSSARAADPVMPASGTCYHSNGYFMGRPIHNFKSGPIWYSDEFTINAGFLMNSSKYLGSTVGISTKKADIYKKFGELDPNKSYVFKYERPCSTNPTWNDSHYLITEIFDMKDDFSHAGIATSFTHDGHHGWQNSGDQTGLIFHVERWGLADSRCRVEINVGGHSSDGKEETEAFMVYGESNCKIAEELIFYPVEVKISYEQFYSNIWDGYDMFIKKLEVQSEDPRNQKATLPLAEDKNYQAYRDRLLNDPVFLQAVAQQIARDQKNAKRTE